MIASVLQIFRKMRKFKKHANIRNKNMSGEDRERKKVNMKNYYYKKI